MKPWSDFFPDVLPSIEPGLPDPMVERQVRRAAQEFCRRTRAWFVSLDAVRTIAGQKSYDIEFPGQAELVRIERATLAGNRLAIWRDDEDGVGQYVFTDDGKTIHLNIEPEDGADLVLNVSLKPSDTSTGVEDAIFDRYSDLIAMEAISRLASDPLRHERFLNECDRVRADLWRGMAAIAPRARAVWF